MTTARACLSPKPRRAHLRSTTVGSSRPSTTSWLALVLFTACSGAKLAPATATVAEKKAPVASSEFPSFVLSQGNMEIVVYPPDASTGYYRGTRFDWSGIIGSIRVGSHTFVQAWQEEHEPTAHDAVTGPAEEFGMESPLGYASAKPGEPFVKIGIGALRRVDAEPYMFNGEYPIVHTPPWRVSRSSHSATFEQELQPTRGFGYHYRKTLKLGPEPATLTIQHWLKNTGAQPIHTNHYAHNFFLLDGQWVGPSYRVAFGFDGTGKMEPPTLAELVGNGVNILAPVPARASLYGSFVPSEPETAFSFELENTQAGAKVKVSGAFAVERVFVWAVREAICPEPFVAINLEPQSERAWDTRYEFVVPVKAAQ